MADIIKEIIKRLPEDSISDAGFEGANIVLYTKDKELYFERSSLIKQIVKEFKKRIELRPDPEITLAHEKTSEFIQKTIPEEAAVRNIFFDSQRSLVIIEAEKPGLAIGKKGEYLHEIKKQTLWVPIIQRMPAIRSELIENIRAVLYQSSDERKKFLNRVGHRIYDGWIRGKKEEWVRLTFLGSGRQVGRSAILLQTPESRVLLDCGLDPGRDITDPESTPYFDALEFKIEELDAVIISHAHTDHTGLVPLLFKYGYRGPVYCTSPTRDVMALLQLDTVKIMRNSGMDPIYTSEEVKAMVKNTITLNYDEVTDITPDIRLTFYNAGHILGASMVHLNIGNGLHNLLYTADLKYARTLILDPAVTKFPRLETMILESTYGSKEDIAKPRKESEDEFSGVIKETLSEKGKVLVPVLGVGRAQEVMLTLRQMMIDEKIPLVPIYIDGMVWDVTAIHTAYPEFLNSNIKRVIFHKDNNPFLYEQFKRVGSAKERKQIIEESEPCIILATSGMLVGGSSVQYLRNLAEDERNMVVLTCYQPPGSLGRRIQMGEKEINMGTGSKPDMMHVKIKTHTFGIKGHSDRKQLMSFIHKCDPRPRRIILNHGESTKSLDLASSIYRQRGIETIVPKNLETLRLK